MPTFECCDRGTHELSAKKAEQGIDVTFDGITKTINEGSTPSALLLGNTAFFSTHEHCIYQARVAVEKALEEATK